MNQKDHKSIASIPSSVTTKLLRNDSNLINKNMRVLGKRTSVRLEAEMWAALADVAAKERCSIHNICSLVALRRSGSASLTSTIRVFLLLYYRSAATNEGHTQAGHGSFARMKERAKIYQHLPSTLLERNNVISRYWHVLRKFNITVLRELH